VSVAVMLGGLIVLGRNPLVTGDDQAAAQVAR
jgi:hypothetical protein